MVSGFHARNGGPERKYGWKRDRPDHCDLHLMVAAAAHLPPSCDLRPGMPPVYDQGELGSCTANAIAAAVDFERAKQGLRFLTPSRLGIYYCERAKEGTVKEDAGAEIRDGIKVCVKQGVAPEMLWPYDIAKFAQKPPEAYFAEAVKHETAVYRRVVQAEYQIKYCLAKLGRPVVLGIAVYESFESDRVAKNGEVPMPDTRKEKPLGGHAVCLCGYDDFTKRFLVRNSWGTGWGMSGYFSIPYAYVLNPSLSSDFWAVLMEE